MFEKIHTFDPTKSITNCGHQRLWRG